MENGGYGTQNNSTRGMTPVPDVGGKVEEQPSEFVGDIDGTSGGFNLGQAPDNARPSSQMDGLHVGASVGEKGKSDQGPAETQVEPEEEKKPRSFLTEDEVCNIYC